MNWTDELILAVLLLSVLMGLWRGFMSEVMALGIWLVAAWVAAHYGAQAALRLPASIQLPSARLIAGYALCFIVVLLAGGLLRMLLTQLIQSTGLGGTDRLLGMVFGFFRGVLLISVLVFLLDFTAFTQDPWWRQSQLLPQFQSMAGWLASQLPPEVYQQLNPARLIRHWPAVPTSVSARALAPSAAISLPQMMSSSAAAP